MPIPMQCDCGKSFRVKDEYAGRKIRCPGCKTVLAVTVPEPKDAEDEALDVLLTADPPSYKPQVRSEQAEDEADEKEERVSARPMPAPKPAPVTKKPLDPGRAVKLPRRPERERGSLGFAVSPTIITGLLMMLGAVVWFVAGLAVGVFFIYPPILFVLGIAAVVRGFIGLED